MKTIAARIARFASIVSISTLLLSTGIMANAESGGVGSPGLPPPPPKIANMACLHSMAPVKLALTPVVETDAFVIFADGTVLFANGTVSDLDTEMEALADEYGF